MRCLEVEKKVSMLSPLRARCSVKRTNVVLFLIIFLHGGVAWALQGCLGLNHHMIGAQPAHASVSDNESPPQTAQVHASLQRHCCEARTGNKWIVRFPLGTNLRSALSADQILRDIASRISLQWAGTPKRGTSPGLEQILHYSYQIGIRPYLFLSILLI